MFGGVNVYFNRIYHAEQEIKPSIVTLTWAKRCIKCRIYIYIRIYKCVYDKKEEW